MPGWPGAPDAPQGAGRPSAARRVRLSAPALSWVAALALWVPCAQAEPRLECTVETSSVTYHPGFAFTVNPHLATSVTLNRHYRIQGVLSGRDGQVGYATVRVHYLGEREPRLLHEVRHALDPSALAQADASGSLPLGGTQVVYSPFRGRELRYACAVRGLAVRQPEPAPQPLSLPLPIPVPQRAPARAAVQPDPADAQLSLAIVGDVMLADGPGRSIRAGIDPFAPFAALLDQADVRMANLECTIATGGSPEEGKPYVFRTHPRVLPLLHRHFDVLGLANNHTGDFGAGAVAEMLDRLTGAGIAHMGAGRDPVAAHTPLVLERHGLRLALLAYDDFLPRHFEALEDHAGVAWADADQVAYDIAQARLAGADLVIPFMHWGFEQEPSANAHQRALARTMIEAGADAVVGSHPHVTQDVEVWHGKPIIYSLGNFVFDGFSTVEENTGWLLQLQLDRAGVQAWRTRLAHLDGRGIPHPGPAGEGQCWTRGAPAAHPCAAGEGR